MWGRIQYPLCSPGLECVPCNSIAAIPGFIFYWNILRLLPLVRFKLTR